jgi:hypothetical protein
MPQWWENMTVFSSLRSVFVAVAFATVAFGQTTVRITGQVHNPVHGPLPNVKGKDTVLYNPRTGNFERAEGAKPSDNNKISNTELNKLQKNQDFQRALDKAKKVLGEK